MDTVIHISIAISFLLLCGIFLNHAESEFPSWTNNATDHASSWKGRSKRSLFHEMPSQLRMRVRYVTGEEVELTYRKTSQYLANEYLPVVAPHIGLKSNVMKDIGEFVLYHDVSECSAVVYYGKFKTLYGIIGINHYIQDLPFNFNQHGDYQLGVVGQPYVKKHDHPFNHIHPGMVYPPPSDSDAWYNFLRPTTHDSDRSLKRPLDCESGPSRKRQRTEQDEGSNEQKDEANVNAYQINNIEECQRNPPLRDYILETLVFVTRDIADIFGKFFGKDQHIEWIVRYLIIYFNAVDMMFKKIEPRHATVHINIAKIVVESDFEPFTGFIGDGDLQFTDIIEKLPQYLNSHRHEHAEDSFDHVFIYTSRPIFDGIIQVNGLTRHGKDLYEARKNHRFYDVVPVTLVRFQYYYADYPVAVHEVGRIFDMKIELREKGWKRTGQCYGVMQREGSKCDHCLKWSEDSRTQLETFLRSNRNRCFLLNKPRSILPAGVSKSLSINTQCQCFGYRSAVLSPKGHYMIAIWIGGCGMPLQCRSRNDLHRNYELTVVPFDGTNCATNKVCWGRECTLITTN